MPDIKEFLSLLETTVKASRLSGSKVQLLSSQSKSLDPSTDTEFVSTFLRLNKSLPRKSTNRISSLYVFDAIARANKGVSGREGLLLKMEGVVDSWVNEMCDDGKGGIWTEGRDKTRKIVDIWTKSSTFPAACLERLSKRLAAAASTSSSSTSTQVKEKGKATPPKPVMSPALPPLEDKDKGRTAAGGGSGTAQSTTPPTAPGSLPPEIQKLLGIQAAQAQAQQSNSTQPDRGAGGITPSIAAPVPTATTPGTGGIDLASILAGITKSPPNPSTTPTAQNASTSAGTTPAAPNPLAALNLDPARLAALASFAQQQTQTTPPQHAATPPMTTGVAGLPRPPIGVLPPVPAPAMSPPAAAGRFPPGPGLGPGGPPPRPMGYGEGQGHMQRGSYDAGPSRRDSGPSGSGYGMRSPPPRGYDDRQDRARDFGGRDWGEADRNGRGGRPRSRSPSSRWDRDGPHAPDTAVGGGGGGGRWTDGPPAAPPPRGWGGQDQGGGGRFPDMDRRDDGYGRRGGRGGGRGGSGRGGRGRGSEDYGGGGRDRDRDHGRGHDHTEPDRNMATSMGGRAPPPRDMGYPSRPPPPSSSMPIPTATGSGPNSHQQEVTGRGRGRVDVPLQPGKDEFGRDIPIDAKPEDGPVGGDGAGAGGNAEEGEEDMALDDSEDEDKSKATPSGAAAPQPQSQPQAQFQMTPQQNPGPTLDFTQQNGNAPPAGFGMPLNGGPLPSSGPGAASGPHPGGGSGGGGVSLDTFDRTSFNPGDPTAWATLGQAWKNSTGREPNHPMELMEWLATGVVGGFQGVMGAGGGAGGGAGTAGGPEGGSRPGIDVMMGQIDEGGFGGHVDGGYGGYGGRGQGRGRGRGGRGF